MSIKNVQHATSGPSTRWGQPWWPEEDAIVTDPTLTVRQAALATLRTAKAVKARRKKLAARAAGEDM